MMAEGKGYEFVTLRKGQEEDEKEDTPKKHRLVTIWVLCTYLKQKRKLLEEKGEEPSRKSKKSRTPRGALEGG